MRLLSSSRPARLLHRLHSTASLPVYLPQNDTPDMKSERASVARLDDVLHLFGEDRRIAAVANLARADAGKGDPADIRQPARSKPLADFLGRVRRRRH